MRCTKCHGLLEILRMCGCVRMRCTECGHQFHINEVADQLDSETEAVLEKYSAIIYD